MTTKRLRKTLNIIVALLVIGLLFYLAFTQQWASLVTALSGSGIIYLIYKPLEDE